MATFLPFFSYSLEGYMKAKRYLLTKDIDVSQLRGFQLVEVANDIKETEAGQSWSGTGSQRIHLNKLQR